MTRCPNCGSAIRVGAKFCTSCGFRLATEEASVAPSAPPASPPATPTRSPFAITTATPPTSSAAWSAPVDRGEPVDPDAGAAEQVPAPPAWAKVEDDAGPAEQVTVVTASDLDGSRGAEGAVDEDDSNHRPGPSWYAPPAPDTSGPVSDDMVAALGGDAADRLGSDVAEETGEAELVLADEPVAEDPGPPVQISTDGLADAGSAVASTSEEASTAGAGTSAGDPLEEARGLAARLAEVLASVQAPGPRGGGSVTAESSIADEGDVDALKAVVEAARERPRDVDVMLDLVLRADTIAAVIADRDLLLAPVRGRGDDGAGGGDGAQPAGGSRPSDAVASGWGSP